MDNPVDYALWTTLWTSVENVSLSGPAARFDGEMELDEALRLAIARLLAMGVDGDDIARRLIAWLPRLCDRRSAHAHIEKLFDVANRDLDRAVTPGHGG